jgi:enamine deaminase RidA (YjgF/YER057c/UK114 family)
MVLWMRLRMSPSTDRLPGYSVLICAGDWNRTTEEYPEDHLNDVDQAFDNVESAVLQTRGKGCEQVYMMSIYVTVVIYEIAELVIRNMKGRCKENRPFMTVMQVVALYRTMKIEIEAEAHLGRSPFHASCTTENSLQEIALLHRTWKLKY